MLIVMSITFISSLLIIFTFIAQDYQSAKQHLYERVDIGTELLKKNLLTSLSQGDQKTTNDILKSFVADPAVVSIRIFDNIGNEFTSIVFKTDIDDDLLFKTKPTQIIHGDESLGEIVVVMSEAEITTQMYSQLVYSFAVVIAVVVFSFVLSLTFQRAISKPIVELHNLTQKVASTGNYTLRATAQSHDEIGRLAEMFNYMLEQVEHRDIMLEKQVGQRTMELEKLAEEFRFRAFHDSLTGLPNRALLNERFDMCVEHARRQSNMFACLLLDLDNFKTINDTKGHDYGDELLKEVARRLKKTIRAEDLVSRLGGDEFVVLLVDLDSQRGVEIVAEKILKALSERFSIKDESIKSAVSIGGALYPDHGSDVITLKRNADVAMYRAKDLGRNQFCLFSPDMQEQVQYRLMIQNDLRRGLEEEQVLLYFQPKILPRLGKVYGCEVLIRWQHPTEGFLPPNKFIPFAEEAGLIQEVDYYVIEQSCRRLQEWSSRFDDPISVAINLSGWHFRSFKIVEVLRASLVKYSVLPSLLEVEITEAVLIDDPHRAQNVVKAIKDLGVGISLDDFGTGYSSLDYLRTLPIDCIKIDRTFVKNIHVNKQDQRITKGIISLAKGLDLALVAEGVETDEHLTWLLDLGCDCIQGYYYLPPSPEGHFLAWVKDYEETAVKKIV